ncbi:hypothetical protein KUV89_14710 [Marinobacter hydrocarbonoclasticus]|nr:hypothetical protein [Marinobacter nauticus]
MKRLIIAAAAFMLAACNSDSSGSEGGQTPVNPIEPPPGVEVSLTWDEQNWDEADWH